MKKIHRVLKPKITKDPINNFMQVGACTLMLLQGEEMKFEWAGIKYTIKRIKEK